MHPWFAPLRRRVFTLAFCLAWVAFELWQGTRGLWLYLPLGFSAYAAMLVFRPPPVDPAKG